MTAANDNRHARKRRVRRADSSRSLATMTRIIHDIYGPDSATKQPDAERTAGDASETVVRPS